MVSSESTLNLTLKHHRFNLITLFFIASSIPANISQSQVLLTESMRRITTQFLGRNFLLCVLPTMCRNSRAHAPKTLHWSNFFRNNRYKVQILVHLHFTELWHHTRIEMNERSSASFCPSMQSSIITSFHFALDALYIPHESRRFLFMAYVKLYCSKQKQYFRVESFMWCWCTDDSYMSKDPPRKFCCHIYSMVDGQFG